MGKANGGMYIYRRSCRSLSLIDHVWYALKMMPASARYVILNQPHDAHDRSHMMWYATRGMIKKKKTLWYIVMVLVPCKYVLSFLNTARPCLSTHAAAPVSINSRRITAKPAREGFFSFTEPVRTGIGAVCVEYGGPKWPSTILHHTHIPGTEECFVFYFWHPMLVRPVMKRHFFPWFSKFQGCV